MNSFPTRFAPHDRPRGFSLVEMLVVIAIMSILMTAGAIGISNLGGRGVTSGVDTTEALVDEARSLAMGKSLRSALLVARELTNNPAEDRRRILVAHETYVNEVDSNGVPVSVRKWLISSRGALLPEQTFFSHSFSKKNHAGSAGDIDFITDVDIKDAKAAYKGSYYIYEFNSLGMPKDPGMSFVIGSGSRLLTQPATSHPPRVVGSAKRDFGGFVIWRNGRTSVFRSPDQISSQLKTIVPGTTF